MAQMKGYINNEVKKFRAEIK